MDSRSVNGEKELYKAFKQQRKAEPKIFYLPSLDELDDKGLEECGERIIEPIKGLVRSAGKTQQDFKAEFGINLQQVNKKGKIQLVHLWAGFEKQLADTNNNVMKEKWADNESGNSSANIASNEHNHPTTNRENEQSPSTKSKELTETMKNMSLIQTTTVETTTLSSTTKIIEKI